MRRFSQRFRRHTPTQQQPTDTGTVKSLEQQRGTGSIAPDQDAQVQADTGFKRAVVTDGDLTTLRVGDRVRFTADPASDRPGYADATIVTADGGNIAGQAVEPVSPSEPHAPRGLPPGASTPRSGHS